MGILKRICFLVLLNCSYAAMAEPTATVFYGNGVLTDCYEALDAKIELERQLSGRAGLPELEYDIACNDSQGLRADLWEAFRQDIGLNLQRFLRLLLRIDALPDSWVAQLGNVSAAFDELAIRNSDLAGQVEKYKTKIGTEGKKVLVVAHSQGNYFVNKAYDFLTETEKRSFGIVAVATPDSEVADGGPHTTSFVDAIILALRTVIITLPPNIVNGITSDDFSGHYFIESYMRRGLTGRSRPQILSNIAAVLGGLDQPVVSSDLVRGSFSGTVFSASGTGGAAVPGGISSGDSVAGTFTYDASQAIAEPDQSFPNNGSHYTFPPGVGTIEISINGLVWLSELRISVLNDYPSFGPGDGVFFQQATPIQFPGSFGVRQDLLTASIAATVTDLVDSTLLPTSTADFDFSTIAGLACCVDGQLNSFASDDVFWVISFTFDLNSFTLEAAAP